MIIREVLTKAFKVIPSGSLSLNGKTFTPSRSAIRSNEKLVLMDTELLERLWRADGESFYITPGPEYKNQIGSRISQFKKYFEEHDDIQVGEFYVHESGRRGGFSNGRHRTRVLIDLGWPAVPVSMDDASIETLYKITDK